MIATRLGGLALFAAVVSGGRGLPAQQVPACPMLKDAQGNLVPDPSCSAQTPATSPAGTPPASAAQRFPFPGETTAPTAPLPTAPAGQGAAAAPRSGDPASKRFPYPGEDSAGDNAPSSRQAGSGQTGAPATPQPTGPPLQDAGSSGSSSSSSSSSSPDEGSSSSSSSSRTSDAAADAADANDPVAVPRRNRHKLPPVPRQSPSEREQEDVQVAGFYQNDGNFKGAYERAKEAVSLDTDDPGAHLALAESARRLGKLDEALKEYKLCLGLDPVPKERKQAEKSLKEMTGGG